MADVYRVRERHSGLDGVLKRAKGLSAEEMRSMENEAQMAAAVKHENVCQIYCSGVCGGSFYIIFEFLPGRDVSNYGASDRCNPERNKLPIDELVKILRSVAEGVQAMHHRNIIHRDLKPGNIMRCEGGTPKVMDFGLARRGATPDVSVTGLGAGTPYYLAPEQSSDRSGRGVLRPPVDVWALGVTLYELLTLSYPYDPFEVRQKPLTLGKPPAGLSDPKYNIPADLQVICRQCLRYDPDHRYRNAGELADDLKRFRNKEPISARDPSIVYRSRLFLWRNQIVASLVAVSALLVLAGGVIAYVAVLNGRLARQEAGIRRQNTQLVSDQAAVLFRDGDPAAAAFQLVRALRDTPPNDHARLRLLRTRMAVVEASMHTLERYVDAGKEVRAMGVADNPSRVVFGTGAGDIKTLDLQSGTVRTIYQKGKDRKGDLTYSALAVGHGKIAVGTDQDELWVADTIGDAPEFRVLLEKTEGFRPYSLSFLAGQLVVGGRPKPLDANPPTKGGTPPHVPPLSVFDVTTGRRIDEPFPLAGTVRTVAVDPTGRYVAAGGPDHRVRVWEAGSRREVLRTPGMPGPLFAVALHTDGGGRTKLATGWRDGRIRLWDVGTGRRLEAEFAHDGPVKALAFSPDGGHLLSGSEDRTARLWDIDRAVAVGQRMPHQGEVRQVAFAPDGRMVTTSYDHCVRVWRQAGIDSLTAGWERTVGVPAVVSAVDANKEGRYVVIGYRDREGRPDPKTGNTYKPGGAVVWDLNAVLGKDCWEYQHEHEVTAVAFSPKAGNVEFVSADNRGSVAVWAHDARQGGKKPRHEQKHTGVVLSVAYDPAGDRLAYCGQGSSIGLYELKERRPTQAKWELTPGEPKGPSFIWSVRFTPDGKQVVADAVRSVRAFDAASGELSPSADKMRMEDEAAAVRGCLLLRSKPGLVALCYDGTVREWDLQQGIALRDFSRGQKAPAHQGQAITAIEFGGTLATGGADNRVRLWDARTGELSKELLHDGRVLTMDYDDAGKRLAVGCDDGSVWAWAGPEWEGASLFFRRGPVTQVRWLPAARNAEPRLLVASACGTVSVNRLPAPAAGDADSLEVRFERLTGQTPPEERSTTDPTPSLLRVGPTRTLSPGEWAEKVVE